MIGNNIEWEEMKLGDICKLKNGFAFKSGDYSTSGISVIRISDISNEVVSSKKANKVPLGKAPKGFDVRTGDILIAMSGATTGKIGVYLEQEKSLQNQRVGNFIPVNDKISRSFLFLLLKFLKPQIVDLAYGGAQPNISAKKIQSIRINLPPITLRNEIVQDVNLSLKKFRAIQTSLTRLPSLLADFREAVLNKAVEKVIFYGRKSKPLKELCTRVTVGFVGKMSDKYQAAGIPFLRSQNVRRFRYSKKGLMFIAPEFEEEIKKSRLFPGDVLVVRSGHPGTTCVLPDDFPGGNCSDILIASPKKDVLNPHFLAVYLNSPLIQRHIAAEKVGIAQAHFNTKSLQRVEVPLLSLKEQQAVVDEVQALYRIADRIEARLVELTQKVEDLPQAILAKAFRGEL